MKILLTNDDSHRSPLLAFIIEELKAIGELVVCVPKHEQSWKGKSMTRFGYLHREEMEIAGYPAYTIDGSPADCVNVAIYSCFGGQKPDLVVSGINAGLNTGSSFIFSSGTVGACFEANIAGLPGIAFSQQFDSETRNKYLGDYELPEHTLKRLHVQTREILQQTFKVFTANPDFLRDPITWNINFPFQAKMPLNFEVCSPSRSRYGNCFKERPLPEEVAGEEPNLKRYQHDLTDIFYDKNTACDQSVLEEGNVTVTPLDIFSFGQTDDGKYKDLLFK